MFFEFCKKDDYDKFKTEIAELKKNIVNVFTSIYYFNK